MHADVLRMAKTKEQREAIKWFHARRVFFNKRSFSDGLELARQSEHTDSRFLVSFFPNAAPATSEEVLAVFMGRQDDPRCLCWAGVFLKGETEEQLYRRSAEGGYAWGQVLWARYLFTAEMLGVVEKAVAQGEPDALRQRAQCAWEGKDAWGGNVGGEDKQRAQELWRQGAELGDSQCQLSYGNRCCAEKSLAGLEWMRRAAVQDDGEAVLVLADAALSQWANLISGRVLFEIGSAVAAMRNGNSWKWLNQDRQAACERAASFCMRCNGEAKRAVLCWLWLARAENLMKDVRLLIANLIWKERAAWSERMKIGGSETNVSAGAESVSITLKI